MTIAAAAHARSANHPLQAIVVRCVGAAVELLEWLAGTGM